MGRALICVFGLLLFCTYVVAQASNTELTKIAAEDQNVRDPNVHEKITRTDAERLEATRRIVDAGQLTTAEDFRNAALIFQHGLANRDYLIAHTLAVIAAAKGDKTSLWLSAASLDRYLQSIGQAQIYGTQYLTPQGKPATQEPYDRSAVTDNVRRILGVETIAEQEKVLHKISEEQTKDAKH